MPTERDVVEFTTSIRDRRVSCRWSAGRITGDPELMGRLSRMVVPAGWTQHPAKVARTISDAVACPVRIRIVDPDEVEVPGRVEPMCPQAVSDGALGDYWIG